MKDDLAGSNMFSPMFSILLIPFVAAMFLTINMGGSGTAPSYSATYGSGVVRKDLIPGLFVIFVFFGVTIAGKKMVSTIGGAILPSEAITLTLGTIILLSVSLSLLLLRFQSLLDVDRDLVIILRK